MSKHTELKIVIQATGWHERKSILGKTIWADGNEKDSNSVFVADMNFHQPHGYSSDFASYCVEAAGPDVTFTSDDMERVTYDYFESADDAIGQVMDHMKKTVDDETFQKRVDEILGLDN